MVDHCSKEAAGTDGSGIADSKERLTERPRRVESADKENKDSGVTLVFFIVFARKGAGKQTVSDTRYKLRKWHE